MFASTKKTPQRLEEVPLVWPVQVRNQMPEDDDRAGGVNSKDAWIESYTISYSSAQVSIPTVTTRISNHPVLAGGTTVVIAPVVPVNVATYLAGLATGPWEVTAELVAKGHLADGSSFETGPFNVVFTACNGCLRPPGDYDPAVTTPQTCTAELPVYVGSCPQEGQTSVPLCVAAATP